jgi:group I intron endonuclease
MRTKKTGIYVIKNILNNKIYIGSAVNINDRWRQHKLLLRKNDHHSPTLQYSWNKYGEENFNFIIIEECNKDILISREQYYLDTLLKANDDNFKFFKSNGYNVNHRADSSLGREFTEKTKVKMSEIKSKNGKLKNIEFSKIDINSFYNNKIISITNKETLASKDKNNPFYGKRHIEESKKIMSEKKMGKNNYFFGTGPMLNKKFTDDHKNKISLSNSGINNTNSKKVYQYDINGDLVKEWDSVGQVCKMLNLSVGNISSCCLNKRRTAYGFIWKYEGGQLTPSFMLALVPVLVVVRV